MMYHSDENHSENPDVLEHDGHRGRIRQRIMESGVESVTPLQLLEFLLYYVLPRQDVEDVSQLLLDEYGDLRSLFAGDIQGWSRFSGLGEPGVQWLELVRRLMQDIQALDENDCIIVRNSRQLMQQAAILSDIVSPPFCAQIITDENGMMLVRRMLGSTLEWADMDLLHDALDDASSTFSKNAYMLVFTRDHHLHPNIYDRTHIQKYAQLLKHAECALRDVLFISETGCTSMFRMNMIPDLSRPKRRFRYVAEDEIEGLLDRDLKIITAEPEDRNL